MSWKPKLLIANRGEIAIRVARTARALGIPTVGVYSEADRAAEHVRYMGEAIAIGPPEPRESYLVIEKILNIAKKTGANLIHPGYGFLSERPKFAEGCEKAGITFVGPSAESMRIMGDKIEARKTVDEIKVPRVPGSPGAVKDAAEAKKFARDAGYPVLLKAAAGGGGKGMRRVDREEDLASSFESASRESLGAFGDGSLYVEKYILEPHHVEIQVFGDGLGGATHLGERECSIQRRHQKVWEETPSPILNQFPKTREKMFECALKIVRHIRYSGAGTLEFIVDAKGDFYFLEMNTRLQVEHPVTEWVTGVDLVEWQLRLAMSNAGGAKWKLPEIPARSGASVEVRLYAEDPFTFLPAPGPIGLVELPMGPFVRSDTCFREAGEVSRHYDPMIAKVSVWGETREQAIGRLRVALEETRILPPIGRDGKRSGSLRVNLSFLSRLCRQERVLKGDTPTSLIADDPTLTAPESADLPLEAAIALSLHELLLESRA